jgi:hypothetical protein
MTTHCSNCDHAVEVVLHYTLVGEYTALQFDDDGPLAVAAQEVIPGRVDDWEARGLWINCEPKGVKAVKEAMESFRRGDHGSELQEYMNYEFVSITDLEGNEWKEAV